MKQNEIHETAIIGPDVILGNGNYIGPYCIITGKTTIGNYNRIEAFASIGTAPEHRQHFESDGEGVIIGSRNVIREYVTINAGMDKPTKIHDDVVLLKSSHVGHDSEIHTGVTISCAVLIGGHSILWNGCNIGLGAILHQRSNIGAFAMIGMGTIVTKKTLIEPGNKYVGAPARLLGRNDVGLEKAGVTDEELAYFWTKWLHS